MPKLDAYETLPSVTFKTGWFEYIAIGSLGSFLTILFLVGMIRHDSLQALPALLIILIALGFIFLWLACFELKVTPVSVSYVTLFAKKRSILIEELAAVEIVTGGKPTYCLLFHPNESCGLSAIAINIKPLKKEDLRKLALFLPKVAPHVTFDRRFLLMAEGNMPSVFFKHQESFDKLKVTDGKTKPPQFR